MANKRNPIVRFFCMIGRGIKKFFLYIVYGLLYTILYPVCKCKIVGKENLKKSDDASIITANHYELFGPVAMFYSFPYKFRPWVIDKMMDPESVENQMSLMIMNNYPRAPIWFKKLVIHSLKDLAVFVMNHAKGISVSRDNLRSNVKTLAESSKALAENSCVVIFPELSYVLEGVGEFQTGFENLAKYHYQKTGEIVNFYPVFVSKVLKTIFIGKPTAFNPEADLMQEKQRIVTYLHEGMQKLYEEYELNNKVAQRKKAKAEKKKAKQALKQEKKKLKQTQKAQKHEEKQQKQAQNCQNDEAMKQTEVKENPAEQNATKQAEVK